MQIETGTADAPLPKDCAKSKAAESCEPSAEQALPPLPRQIAVRRVIDELTSIGFGTKQYPEYDKNGCVIQVYPTLSVRLKALELVLKNLQSEEESADNGILPELLLYLKEQR